MKASIIGGGVIGGGWAARFLLNGWDVAIFDPDPEAERKVGEVLANARASLPQLYETRLPPEGRLSFAKSLEEAVAGADWVQESVPERLEIKHAVFRQVQDVTSSAVIASSTSGFKPSQLREGALRPDEIIVAHPFNPVYLLPLVELVGTSDSSSEIRGKALKYLTKTGMMPLEIRAEIDAHIADRLLEAVWREALWLIKDDVATTQEIDDAIRFGFGLRWAQMGLFETYRIAGGEAGMKHFIEQFGPCLEWPWTKLMDVPELTEALVQKISDQSDAQSGAYSIRELERHRDHNLVAMMRALKARNWGAGKVIKDHEKTLDRPDQDGALVTVDRVVPVDWADYNGHMNESRYGQVFSDAADFVLERIGADENYIRDQLSFFTVDIQIKFIAEVHVNDHIIVHSLVREGKGKKLKLFHEIFRGGEVVATGEQLLIHVSLETRRACEPREDVLRKLEALAEEHAR